MSDHLAPPVTMTYIEDTTDEIDGGRGFVGERDGIRKESLDR